MIQLTINTIILLWPTDVKDYNPKRKSLPALPTGFTDNLMCYTVC